MLLEAWSQQVSHSDHLVLHTEASYSHCDLSTINSVLQEVLLLSELFQNGLNFMSLRFPNYRWLSLME